MNSSLGGILSKKFITSSVMIAVALLGSGCASLKGREVTLRPQRLTVLEAHNRELGTVGKLALSVKRCPREIDAEALLRRALGGATSFEIAEGGSKERLKDSLTVECTTAVERDGGALGASKPAAIGLMASLSSSNDVIWSARYFYRDRDVAGDVLGLKDRLEVGGGGVRFASLSELAGAGIQEIAAALGEARDEGMLARR